MATEAQIEANRNNAIASTGPTTPEGKSKSSRNAVSHGLFSTRDILDQNDASPGEATAIGELITGLQKDLSPLGTLEQTFADEITRAAYRLRRCACVEDSLADGGLDPMVEPTAGMPTQVAIDRARAEAHRILKRSMDELRRLQNERRFRLEVLLEGVDNGDLGLASYKDLMPAMAAEKRWQRLKREEEGLGSFQSMLETAIGPHNAPPTKQTQSAPAPAAQETKRTQTAPLIVAKPVAAVPRNAPCPCGSGQKHKRCCGQNASAVLTSAAA